MSKFCLNETHDTDFPLEVPLLQCSKQKKIIKSARHGYTTWGGGVIGLNLLAYNLIIYPSSFKCVGSAGMVLQE